MAAQLGVNNTQQRLIASGQKRSVQNARTNVRREIEQDEDNLVVNASEKRYLWTARAFAVVTAISLCCNLILLLTIANILPLYRVEPYLLTLAGKDEQVYNIIPYSRDMEAKKSITETFIRQYVLLRTTLLSDVEEMEARWQNGGDLQKMSSPIVYQDFMSNTAPKLMKRMKEDGLTSNVSIITVNEISESYWQVEYSADYYLPTSYTPKKLKYRASLRVQYVPQRVSYKERLKNPVGFTVLSYTTKQIRE
ncbi:MAG: type IV secretion system protein [Alphaproteobacteria bacterium]|nr:type IV secretion system protein [Alphaproteobacteria bacterium]